MVTDLLIQFNESKSMDYLGAYRINLEIYFLNYKHFILLRDSIYKLRNSFLDSV